ncbi:MAG: helix-turn-helix transcriptional regulator [Asgard group archaeon]
MIVIVLSLTLFSQVISVASASYDYYDYDASVEVFEDNSCFLLLKSTVVNTGVENLTSFEQIIGASFSNLRVKDEGGDLGFSVRWAGGIAIVSVLARYPVAPGNAYTYFVQFSSNDLVTSSGELHIFSLGINLTHTMQSFSLRVNLPRDAKLAEYAGGGISLPSVSPEPTATYRSEDEKVTVLWSKTNITASDTFPFTETYIVQYNIATKSWLNLRLFASILVGFALVSITSFLIAKHFFASRWGAKESSRLIKVLLTSDENKIINVITSAGGKIKQDEIVKETGFSRAKISAYLTKLEKRGIIERERYGKTNIVKIKDKIELATCKE